MRCSCKVKIDMKKKRQLYILIFLLLAIVGTVIYTFAVGSHYTQYTNFFRSDSTLLDYQVEYEKEGIVEVTDVHYADDGELVIDYDAIAQGATDINITYSVRYNESPDKIADTYRSRLKVTSFNLIVEEGRNLEFQAFQTDLIILMLLMLILLLSFIVSYILDAVHGNFNYRMVMQGGLGSFIFVLLLFLLYKMLNHSMRFFYDFLSAFLDIGVDVFLLIAPIMMVVSVLLAFSNIWLMRHEGYRPVNTLGIIFGIMMGILAFLALSARAIPAFKNAVDPTIVERTALWLFCYFGAMFIATMVTAFLAAMYRPPLEMDYIIILGCGIREDGTLMPLLKGRVDAALDFEKKQFQKTGKHAIFVPSGGQGPDEVISESQAMTNYLLEQGVPREQILLEDKSTNTMQNMQFSKEVIKRHSKDFENSKIAFATTNYHVFRGYILAQSNGFKAKGISAKTKFYFFPNAFLREFIGLLVNQKFKHIAFIAATLVVFVVSNAIITAL